MHKRSHGAKDGKLEIVCDSKLTALPPLDAPVIGWVALWNHSNCLNAVCLNRNQIGRVNLEQHFV